MLVDGFLRVQLHAVEIGRETHGARPDIAIEQMAQIVGRVGGHQQHAAPFIGHGQRRGGGHRGLAHAALATEEQDAFRTGKIQQHET